MAVKDASPARMDTPTPPLTSVFVPGLFAGQSALVTGGGTGIGFAIARLLFHLGARVLIAARREAVLRDACERLEAERGPGSGSVSWTVADIRSDEAVAAMVATAVERNGPVRLLVQNSGGQFLSPAADMSIRGFATVVRLNLESTFRVCRAVYDACMAEGGGSIVTMSLDVGNGVPGMAHSAAARAGINNLVKTLAQEWAASGVRLNSVAPGIIYSESAFAHYGAAADELVGGIVRELPALRLGTPEEVAGVMAFLLSPAAAYVTGSTVVVGGGSQLVRKPLLPRATERGLPFFGALPPLARL